MATINPEMVGLALVDSGWTGDVQITRGATTETITPQGRTSAAAIWSEVVRAAQNKFGGTWQGWPDSAGKLHIVTSLASFDLVCSGTTKTRLVFTGTYTGAAEYTAASAHHSAVYPAYGMRLSIGVASRATRAPSANGDFGGSGARMGPSGSMVCYGTYAEIVSLESALDGGETHDAWIGGRVVGRVRLGEVKRNRWGGTGAQAYLDVGATVVTL
jgi:hypothetical protein